MCESVSIIIPCRNEAKYIANCLNSIIANDNHSRILEIIIVDGMSEDGTRSVIDDYIKKYPIIKVLENPLKNTPVALNTGIRNSKGDVIIRMDAHSEYPPHYISKCLEILQKTMADVVGGPLVTKSGDNSFVAESIAFVTSHPFGVGNSKFRTSNKEGFVDTVPFGAFRKGIFEKVGLFDERLERNQDNELNNRIIRNGGKIYQAPELTCIYYNQSTLGGLVSQALKTGVWNAFTLKVHPSAFRWRHFVPFIFVLAIFLGGVFFGVRPEARFFLLGMLGLYFSMAVVSSIHISLEAGFKFAFVLPFIFFIYHFFYGLGTLTGFIKTGFLKWGSGGNTFKGGKDNEGFIDPREIF